MAKINFSKIVLIVLFWLNPSVISAFASEVLAVGRLSQYSPVDKTAVDGHFKILYKNLELPNGTRVLLHYGFQRGEFYNGKLVPVVSWSDGSEIEMVSAAPNEWHGEVRRFLYAEDSEWQRLALHFMFKIVLPNGKITFDKGSDSVFSYYRTIRPYRSKSCDPFFGPYCFLSVEVVR